MAYAGKLTYKTELDTSGVQKAGSTVKSIIAGLGITKMIRMAMSEITNSIDDAIARFDTMNNFPKVMSNLGIGAEEADKSIKKMSEKLSGLPTTLDQGALAVQRFTSANGDVEKSTDIFLALNNAILAGGASTEIQASALEQMSQAYAKGKPDMMEWRSLMTAMPAQLKQVADAMGYASADELGESLRKGTVSMNEFMGAIVRLNTEGLEGFQNFEEQARNATGGIGTAIIVAKTQVVKGLTDILDGIDKGLKKSGTSINKIISDLGKKTKEVLDKIAKALSKIDFNKLYKIIKTLIPVMGALVTSMIAYNTAVKATKLVNLISQAKNFANIIKILIPSLTGAKTAMGALNASFLISPIGLLVTGVAGLTTGLILLNKVTNSQKTEQEKINDTLSTYKKEIKEVNQARQEYLDQNMNEIQNTENLANELKALVDENGRVKEGYEDRVKFIIGELNSALGTEITMTDGVIDNYKEMSGVIYDVIKAKRAKVLLDAQEEVYNKAKDKQVEIEKNYAEAQKEANKATKERGEYLESIIKKYKLTAEQINQLTTEYKVLDKNGNEIISRFGNEAKELQKLDTNYRNSNITLKNAGKTYADNQKIIGDYEIALVNLQNKNYDVVLSMYQDTTNYQGKTKEDTSANYASAIQSQEAYLDYLKENKKKYNEDVYNAEVEATKQRIAQLQDEQEKMKATVNTGQLDVKNTWNNGLTEQLSILTGHKILFQKTGNGHIQAYIDGVKQGKPMSKKEAKNLTEEMQKEIRNAKNGSKQAGYDFTLGTTRGIQSGQGGTFNAVRNYGNNILASLRKALKERSPSKATREIGLFFDKGVELGVKDGEKTTLKTINQFGNNILNELSSSMDFNKELDDMYKEMNRTIKMENSKMNFDVLSGDVYNKSFYQTPVSIDLNANVEMDSQKVGRLVTPSVTRTIKNGGGI